MNNFLDFFLAIFSGIIIVLYFILGGIFDISLKISSAIICIVIAIVYAIIRPFLSRCYRFKFLNKIYNHGSQWGLHVDNYPLINKLSQKYFI